MTNNEEYRASVELLAEKISGTRAAQGVPDLAVQIAEWALDQRIAFSETMLIELHKRMSRLFGSPPKTKGGAITEMRVKGYEELSRVLHQAYRQSANGKGRERHGNGRPFDQQPIMNIARMTGIGGHTYQISKKAQEAGNMIPRGQHDAAIAEFYGVIVYAAAAVLLTEELKRAFTPADDIEEDL